MMGQDEKVYTGSTGSGAKDRDSLWVSSKVLNVFIEPAQSLDLVQQTIVPLSRLVPRAQKSCRVNKKKQRQKTQVMCEWRSVLEIQSHTS